MEFPDKKEILTDPDLFLEKSVKVFKAKVYRLTGVDLLYAVGNDSGFEVSTTFKKAESGFLKGTVQLTESYMKISQNFCFYLESGTDGIKLKSIFFSGKDYYFVFENLDSMVYFTKFYFLFEKKMNILSLLFASLNVKEEEIKNINFFDKIIDK
jgi:hypothetical protein